MKLAYLAFSDKGFALAQKLAESLGGVAYRSGQPLKVHEWTEVQFTGKDRPDGIVYVGAVGIAVRAIAPFIEKKTQDPAIVVIDELALHVIPILSGHLGGANDLARQIASETGSDCVITTATDINGIFAVDEWSKRQGCILLEPEKIVRISGPLLVGNKVTVWSRWPIEGEAPDGIQLIAPDKSAACSSKPALSDTASASEADIMLDVSASGSRPLHLIPSICFLGVGCRKGIDAATIEGQFAEFLKASGIHEASIDAVATIDIKRDEAGLLQFCENHGWPLITYTSEELKQVPGDFSSSAFVSSVTGVDNVCERSAVLASGGELIQGKTAGNGVTLALAMKPYKPNWNWKDK